MSSSSSSSSSIIPPSYESLTPQPEGGPTPAAPSNSNVWNGTEDSEELREARSQAYNQAPEILQDYIQMLLHNRREDESFLARLKEVIHGQEREEVRANQRYDDMKRASEAAKAECGRLEKEANNLFERKQMYKADFAAMRASKNELLVEKNNWEVLYNDILADRDELQGLYDGIRVELDEHKSTHTCRLTPKARKAAAAKRKGTTTKVASQRKTGARVQKSVPAGPDTIAGHRVKRTCRSVYRRD